MGDVETSFSDGEESPMKHHSFEILILTRFNIAETVSDGQFKWGTCLLKGNGGVYKVG